MSNDIYREGSLAERWDDTARTVTTYDTAGQVTSTRPYTADENTAADERAAGETRAAVAAALAANAGADEAKIAQAIADLLTLLGDDTQAGSIRAIIGPSTATAGTTSLRALRQQSNTAIGGQHQSAHRPDDRPRSAGHRRRASHAQGRPPDVAAGTPRHGRPLHCGCRHGRLMAARALILRAVDRHIARADQRILVRLIALGMIGRGLIDLGRRLNR